MQGALGEVHALARTAASGLALMRRLHAPLAAQEVRLRPPLEALIDAGAGHRRRDARAGSRAGLRQPCPASRAFASPHSRWLSAKALESVGEGEGTVENKGGRADAAAVPRSPE